jgi:hypothetical protein
MVRNVETRASKGIRVALQQRSDKFEALQCGVCLDLLVKPTSLGACVHVFCFDCIWLWSQRSEECPLCRTKSWGMRTCNATVGRLQTDILQHFTQAEAQAYGVRVASAASRLRRAMEVERQLILDAMPAMLWEEVTTRLVGERMRDDRALLHASMEADAAARAAEVVLEDYEARQVDWVEFETAQLIWIERRAEAEVADATHRQATQTTFSIIHARNAEGARRQANRESLAARLRPRSGRVTGTM